MVRNEYFQDLVEYSRQFLGSGYVWGTNGPNTFDCSGWVCFLLRREGLVGGKEDLSASGLFLKFKNQEKQTAPYPSGTLLFFGQSETAITHVSMVIDAFHHSECGGGNEKTDTVEKALALGACVRERPIKSRSDIVAAIRPAFPWD